MADERPAQFRALLNNGSFFTVPGVFDGLSALVAEQADFPALFMTGYGTVVSHLGLPDSGVGTYSDFLGRLSMIAERTTAPILADADTGFGGIINVRQTVRGYEAAGAAAIQIEDQEFPKRCGHTDGKRVISAKDMALKIRVAVEARRNDDFCIVARTDARAELGLDEAIRRGQAYVAAGADVIFIEAPQNEAEMARISGEIDAPLVANMTTKGSKTPEIPGKRLADLGYSFAIHPGVAFLSAAAAMRNALAHLKKAGDTTGYDAPQFALDEMHELVGFYDIIAFEKRWAEEQADGRASG
jgi:2-methylisocitrate lyase-like PEP mutase family enzyme